VERIPARVRLLHSTTAVYSSAAAHKTRRTMHRQVAPCCNLLRPHRSPRGAGNSLETYST
jgi:hypothetical protein